MARRLVFAIALALLAAGSAAGQDPDGRKQSIDERIDRLKGRISETNRREGALTSEISAVTAKVRRYAGEVDGASLRLATLERELVQQRNRLAALTELLGLQTTKLKLLRRQHVAAQRRRDERLIRIYQAQETGTVEVVLAASSFSDLVDQLDYRTQVGAQDRLIAGQVAGAKRVMALERARTQSTRREVESVARAVEERTSAQRAVRDRLLASKRALEVARNEKRHTLSSVQADEREFLHEVAGLERTSAALGDQIRAAQAAAAAASAARAAARSEDASTSADVNENENENENEDQDQDENEDEAESSVREPASIEDTVVIDATPSPSGFVWPVSGPVTSGFGWRWGRMHEGIDIGVGSGTPIVAAASGVVIYAGWMGGYGNLIVVDHGGGVSTSYAHQSAFGAGVGQPVAQGQTIGYVGCTGHCFGDHLHFEVRIGGSPVDPLGYL